MSDDATGNAKDLLFMDPQELARLDLERLLAIIEKIEGWTDRHGEVLDYVYQSRLTQLLVKRAPVSKLLAFEEHLALVAHDERRALLNALGKHYYSIWNSYREILEGRVAALESTVASEVVRDYSVVRNILRLLFKRRTATLTFIEDAMGIRDNLPRILELMEVNELIERQGEEQGGWISLGCNAFGADVVALVIQGDES